MKQSIACTYSRSFGSFEMNFYHLSDYHLIILTSRQLHVNGRYTGRHCKPPAILASKFPLPKAPAVPSSIIGEIIYNVCELHIAFSSRRVCAGTEIRIAV